MYVFLVYDILIMKSGCIFCSIVAGKAESSKIYEDDKILAFMGIHPVHTGECMVISKEHIDHFTDIPDNLAAHILVVAQKIGKNILKELKPLRIGYVVHGFGVPHAHLLIIPLHEPEEITSKAFAYIEGGRVLFSENRVPLADRKELDRIATVIKVNKA